MNLHEGINESVIPIIFLETTACIGYSVKSKVLRYKPRLHYVMIRTTYFDKLYMFIDHCYVRRDLCKLVITNTIKNECEYKIRELIYELMDRKDIHDEIIYIQILKESLSRLRRLLKKVSVLKIEATKQYRQIKDFYHSIGAKPPGADMQILAEAAEIAKKNQVFFVTGDYHFLNYKDKIRNLFNLNLLAISNLPVLPQGIVNLLACKK